MKKIILTLAAVVGIGFSQLSAQSVDISYGAKVNANMSNFLLNDMKDNESSMKLGVSVGGFLKFEFTENFAIQPEVSIYYKGSKMKDKRMNIKYDNDFWGFEIPVYAVGQMNLGTGKGYVGLGPYIGCNFSGKADPGDINLYKKDKVTDTSVLKRWDFGAGLMAGYEFDNRFSINASYQIGFLDLLDANKKHSDARNQTVSLGVGYRF